jgi:hypothetical protein
LLPFSYLDELLVRLSIAVAASGLGIIVVSAMWLTHTVAGEFATTLVATIVYSLGLSIAGLLGLEATLLKRGMRTRDRSKAILRLVQFGFVHRAHLKGVRFASEPLLPGRREPIAALHALCFTCDIDERYSGNY